MHIACLVAHLQRPVMRPLRGVMCLQRTGIPVGMYGISHDLPRTSLACSEMTRVPFRMHLQPAETHPANTATSVCAVCVDRDGSAMPVCPANGNLHGVATSEYRCTAHPPARKTGAGAVNGPMLGGNAMANDYIPRKDAARLQWMQNFANKLVNESSKYGVSPSDAQTVRAAVDEFEQQYRLAHTQDTRTTVTVAAKDLASNSAEAICRQYAVLIKHNAGISDDAKISLRIRPVNRGRSRIAVPASSPLLSIVGCTPYSQTLRYRDTYTPESSAKPFGAAFLELRVAIGDEKATDPEQARPAGMYTRNPIGVGFTHDDDRKRATYFARWVSRRGDTGPWSVPVSMSIAA